MCDHILLLQELLIISVAQKNTSIYLTFFRYLTSTKRIIKITLIISQNYTINLITNIRYTIKETSLCLY